MAALRRPRPGGRAATDRSALRRPRQFRSHDTARRWIPRAANDPREPSDHASCGAIRMSVAVLVVDDEPLARRKLTSMLTRVAWANQIGEAGDGLEALEAVARGRPDIVLLDIEMPELSGIQVIERLRALEAPPAVILTTAYNRYAVTAFEL